MFKRTDSSVLRVYRPVCHHNFRPTARKTSAGHSSVCLLCVCERIDEFLENDSDNIPPSRKVNDIMHNVRLIHTTLDSYDRMDGVLSEITVRPVIDTLIELLKLANDEIGLMIAQAIQIICTKISSTHENYLLEKIVDQIRKSPTGLTLGTIECLRVILQIEECLVVFQEKFGQEVLPIVLQTLLSRGNVERRFPFPSLKLNDTNINSQENVSQNSFNAHSQGYKEEKYRTIIAVYAVIERTYEMPSLSRENNSSSVDMGSSESSENEKDKMYKEYIPYTHDIISDCIKLLSECLHYPLLLKVLEVLSKVMAHIDPLSTILSSGQGYSLLSQLKKMLFSPYPEVQKETLAVFLNSLETYRAALITCLSTGVENAIEELPKLIHKVDILHGLSQTISTSDPETYRTFFQLLKMLHAIPFFKGKLLVLVEDALRFSALSLAPGDGLHGIHQFFQGVLNETEKIPFTVQKQIVSVYANLPVQVKQIERLQWAKLLLHCSDTSLRSIIIPFFYKSVEMLETNGCSVSNLKLALILFCSVNNCSEQNELANAESFPPFLLILMKLKCLPAVKALATEGNVSEAVYIRILLLTLLEFPLDRLRPPRKISIDSFSQFSEFYAVEYEIEDYASSSSIARTQKVVLSQNNLFDEDGSWSAGAYMKILSWIRQNMDLLQDKVIFDLWNENVGRIVTEKAHQYFPGIFNLWPQTPSEDASNGPVRRTFFSTILDKLDLDMTKWRELFGQNSVKNMEIDDGLVLRQEAALVYYYYYLIFTMDDEKTLLSPSFLTNLSQLLQNTVENIEYLASSGRSKETILSAYFKLTFLIFSCHRSSLKCHPDPLCSYETMILELEAILNEEPQRVVTYCGVVFETLVEWQLFSLFQLSVMMSNWAGEDKQQFQRFLENIDLSPDNVDDDSVASYKALVLEIAAEGSKEASEFVVQMVRRKRSKKQFNFEPGHIYEKLIVKKNDIIFASYSEAAPLSSLNSFSNLLELAMGDEPMFCKELINFPAEFFDDVILILLKYYETKSIGVKCMKFLWKYLSLSSNIDVQRICLQNHGFVHLLGSLIQKPVTASMNELTYYSYEILSTLVRACDIPDDYRIFWKQGSEKVKWCIASVLGRNRFPSSELSWLKFLTDMVALDFKHDVIEVEEIKMDEIDLWKLLFTINLYVQNQLHRILDKEDGDLIWSFFFELLCFSKRMDSRSNNKGNIYLTGRLYADPWNAFFIQLATQNVQSPVELSEPCLKFLLKWMKTIVIHLRVAGEKNVLSVPKVSYLANTILQTMKNLYDFFGCGRPKPTKENLHTSSTMSGVEWNARFPTTNIPENEKTLIEKLVKYCTIIMESHKGKGLCGYTSEEEDEGETLESLVTTSIDETKSNPTESGYEANESDSSTCSESELENIIKANNMEL